MHIDVIPRRFAEIEIGDKRAQTRVCYRNRNPLFGQTFFFPLQGHRPSDRVCISLYGTHTGLLVSNNHFMGQVLTTLGLLLSPVPETMLPHTRW